MNVFVRNNTLTTYVSLSVGYYVLTLRVLYRQVKYLACYLNVWYRISQLLSEHIRRVRHTASQLRVSVGWDSSVLTCVRPSGRRTRYSP